MRRQKENNPGRKGCSHRVNCPGSPTLPENPGLELESRPSEMPGVRAQGEAESSTQQVLSSRLLRREGRGERQLADSLGFIST